MNWQLIETAPKDGTRILVCDTLMNIGVYRWWHVSPRNIEGWRADHNGWFSTNLTHWMPLPDPPTA